jgi:hypothetical protein
VIIAQLKVTEVTGNGKDTDARVSGSMNRWAISSGLAGAEEPRKASTATGEYRERFFGDYGDMG